WAATAFAIANRSASSPISRDHSRPSFCASSVVFGGACATVLVFGSGSSGERDDGVSPASEMMKGAACEPSTAVVGAGCDCMGCVDGDTAAGGPSREGGFDSDAGTRSCV